MLPRFVVSLVAAHRLRCSEHAYHIFTYIYIYIYSNISKLRPPKCPLKAIDAKTSQVKALRIYGKKHDRSSAPVSIVSPKSFWDQKGLVEGLQEA